MNPEQVRLAEARAVGVPWRQWGPYLSERQWGTVREDYSDSGNAWDYLPHDHARSRAYRWGEDGIAGISDERQRLCFALCLWNGRDPILKERLFGLTNSEGNHGEDVKEYYFYIDNTPTHSYMRYLYKYPHAEFPYADLVETNRARGRHEMEYELLDTGIFAEQRYFDVDVEYAKAGPADLLIRIAVHNRGPAAADLQLLPTLWFRNTWSWGDDVERPSLSLDHSATPVQRITAQDAKLGSYTLDFTGAAEVLFTENETNTARLFGAATSASYVKDSFHRYVINGEATAVNPAHCGTKATPLYRLTVPADGTEIVRLRLRSTNETTAAAFPPPGAFDATVDLRRSECDHFYQSLATPRQTAEEAVIIRQAMAGMLWTKQFYYYDVDRWLDERGAHPTTEDRRTARNDGWHHMYNADIISMPDKWEYPWYAAWDLAFHVIALSLVDKDFAKDQLDLMLRERYLHPNGQIPAYEWNFGDVNPPVHAWATIFAYRLEAGRHGEKDLRWLEHSFQKLLLNFTWWVNRKDRDGHNVFEGGFLGLDNIGVFDRSKPLPTGGFLEQADGTAWMALFAQNMLEIAAELSRYDDVYVEMAVKFLQHYLWIASAMLRPRGGDGMWDDEDGFFYDVLRLPDGSSQRLKVRSLVGLLPLCSVCTYERKLSDLSPEAAERFTGFLRNRPELLTEIHDPRVPGYHDRHMTAILNEDRLRLVLARMLDEEEFLSDYGIRSLSRFHRDHPYVVRFGNEEYRVEYLPAESDSGMFGGNSNWRGPIWMPMNALIIRALLHYYSYYGDNFRVEFPTGSGNLATLFEIAQGISQRLANIFLPDENGHRPVFGGAEEFRNDPHWRDCLQFYEYFHGDNGAGLGANHQTGWTGCVARLIHLFSNVTAEEFLAQATTIFREQPANLSTAGFK